MEKGSSKIKTNFDSTVNGYEKSLSLGRMTGKVKDGFNYVKDSRVGKFLYDPKVEGEAIRNAVDSGKGAVNYVKEHPIRTAVDVIGLALFGVTAGSDIIALHDKPSLVQQRILFEGQKPKGMSILPPQSYSFNPPGGSLEPLSLADRFSIAYPITYLGLQAARGAFYLYKWKKSKD